MKQPHRWAAIVAALLMATSLVIAPREGGAAGTTRPIDWVGPPEVGFGDPDIPDYGPQATLRIPAILWSIGMRYGVAFPVSLAPRVPARLARVNHRPADVKHPPR